MEPYLAKACRRAATRLGAGGVLLIAIVGLRIVTATPRGIEGELAELERFEAEAASGPATGSGDGAGLPSGRTDGHPPPAASDTADRARADEADPDRLVRCHVAAQRQYMRAADCETRGGVVEERPAAGPEPTAASAPPDR